MQIKSRHAGTAATCSDVGFSAALLGASHDASTPGVVDPAKYGQSKHDTHGPLLTHAQVGTAPTVIDPVCGMAVDPLTGGHKLEHGGHTYWHWSLKW